jgi:hypothetical protein
MDIIENAIMIIGLTSVSLLWIFSVVGGLHTVWETCGEHAEGLIKRIRG